MGPRPFGRGDRAPSRPAVGLECFNGAAAFRPRRRDCWWHYRQYYVLQWGRGLSAAETSPPTKPSGPTPSFNGAAAFRPRRPGLPLNQAGAETLQWGRGLSAAETTEQSPHSDTAQRFNGAAAFRPRRREAIGKGAQIVLRFNGAAAFRPRRPPLTRILLETNAASMGPRPFGRGDAIASRA